MTTIIDDIEAFNQHGFLLCASGLTPDQLSKIAATLDADGAARPTHSRSNTVYAARDLFARLPALLRQAEEEPLVTLASKLAGTPVRPTKATFFDKRQGANWTLPLHQDLTITVAAQAEVAGYTHWSMKAGVPHVQPPVAILENIVALRIHLDDCPEENGALEVVPGSHRLGRINPEELRRMHCAGETVACPAAAGEVLAMRPLLVHGSRKSSIPARRRVLHIEYCGETLDSPLQWPVWNR